jgi:ABC-type spermidine/putrescine transport system permease subunit I
VALVEVREGRRAWRAQPEALVLGALVFCLAVYLVPMLTLGAWAFRDRAGAFTLAHLSRLIGDEAYHDAFLITFRTAGVTTLVCVLLGYPLAYLMATAGPRARVLLFTAVMIPFWTSILARSLAWVILLGRRGVINQWLTSLGIVDQPLPLLFNSIGVQIGMVHVLLPFMILPIWSVLTRLDPALPLAARSLGATQGRAFLYVVLPQSLPGLAAGMTLVFMLAVGFYITPALLGGPNDLTIVSLIEMVVRDLLDWSFGAMLSLTLLALVGAIFAVGAIVAGADRFTGAEGRA